MKIITTLFAALVLAATAHAGEAVYSKNPKAPVIPPPPAGCDCFGPGLSLGVFGGGLLPDGDSSDDVLGGGALVDYFFNEYIGVQGSYGIYATSSEHHEFDAALVLRYPITSICIAPYVMGGAGYATNSEDNWNWFAGAGLEARFSEANCFGVFADGAYHWGEDDSGDFTIVRIGVKFKL